MALLSVTLDETAGLQDNDISPGSLPNEFKAVLVGITPDDPIGAVLSGYDGSIGLNV